MTSEAIKLALRDREDIKRVGKQHCQLEIYAFNEIIVRLHIGRIWSNGFREYMHETREYTEIRQRDTGSVTVYTRHQFHT